MRLFLCLFLCFPFLANAQEIATKKVGVEALLIAKQIRPVIENHRFEPIRPKQTIEPFSPKIRLQNYDLPKGMMLVTPVHWLTEFSGGLAATFLGSKGQFQRGQLAYKEKRFADAKKAFAVLFKRKGGTQWEQTGLWQAWSMFYLEEMGESLEVARELFDAKDPAVRAEAYYIAGLHHFLSSRDEQLFSLLKESEAAVPKKSWGVRLHLLNLTALVRSERWKEAHEALLALDVKSFERDENYKNLVQLQGVIYYQGSDFKNSLQAYIKLEKLQDDISSRVASLKNIAWMYYLSGDYPKAKKTAHFVIKKLDLRSQAEMHYLWIAAQVQLQKAEGLFQELKELPQSSEFYSYASFYIRSFYKNLNDLPRLKSQVQNGNFEFPELKFYTAILEGHGHFLIGDYDQAKTKFLQALAVDSKSGLYWVAQYNMALIYLKQNQYQKGLGLLAELEAVKEAPQHLLGYHQLFVLYQKKQDPQFLTLVGQVKTNLLGPKEQWEVILMQGALLYNQNKEKEALSLFQRGWGEFKEPEALGYVAQVYYFKGKYKKVLSFASQHTKPKSVGLTKWKVKSLLALRKFVRAKRVIEDGNFKGSQLLGLHVEVWLNTKDFKKIIAKVRPLIATEKNQNNKVLYYSYLGDAFYNLKDYHNAQVNYGSGLKYAKGKNQRSGLLYNQVMSFYLAENLTAYEAAAKSALNEPLEQGVRFQLTENLANYLQSQGRGLEAQKILSAYAKQSSYKKAQVQLQQVRLLKESGNLADCAALGSQPVKGATAMEKRDLLILSSRCSVNAGQGKKVLASLEKELMQSEDVYRKAEITLLLAEARNQVGGYASSQEMIDQLGPNTPKAFRLQAKLIKAENQFQMGQIAQADATLGDPSQYHEVELFGRALELQTQIKTKQGDLKQAVKNILRQYYKKGQTLEAKQAILLRLAKLYASKDKFADAKETMEKLNSALLSPDLQPEYKKLEAELAQK